MDTSLLDEVTTHFAEIANECDVDMVYFDGAERLQGEHWYYNGLMIHSFYEKLQRSDILLQASSSSHFSWRYLARNASADGHGDLKGYLDQRSPAFDYFAESNMPLDIGWYYGYDTNTSLDMYEYILGATIGYDSSMSFQVSPGAAANHPFTGAFLDRISQYETLRRSGKVSDAMRERLQVHPKLRGQGDNARPALVRHRQEYRLVGKGDAQAFQRVVYHPWNWKRVEKMDGKENTWTLDVSENGTTIGMQLHVLSGPWRQAGPSYDAADAIVLETFDDIGPYKRISTSESVSQSFSHGTDSGPRGKFAVYSATCPSHPGGWSCVGKSFKEPLDLSRHQGVGFWLRGDGKGGAFKLQLLDAKGSALDFYIKNDFTGWTYRQLAFAEGHPTKRPPQMSDLRSMSFYYNGLPKGSVACGIDDVKAIAKLDEPILIDPVIQIGDQKIQYRGRIGVGQYLFVYPDEPAKVYGPTWKEPSLGPAKTITLDKGTHQAVFRSKNGIPCPIRVRIVIQPPERYSVDAG